MPRRPRPHERLRIPVGAVTDRLERAIAGVVRDRFGHDGVVLGLSGGVDSAVVAALAARALGPDNVLALHLPYRDLAEADRHRARRVARALGIRSETIDITAMVDAYAETRSSMTWHRRGNVQARVRMVVQFDLMVEHGLFPVGASNRTERLLGYFTEHGDGAPQLQPIGDLYKTQVWQLAEDLALPSDVIEAVPSAGLEPDQTDEGDFGMPYEVVDLILAHMDAGETDGAIRALGVPQASIDTLRQRIMRSHRKRLPQIVPQVQPYPSDPTLFLRGALGA